MKEYIDEEYEEAYEKGKSEKDVDHILTDYPGIVIKTYKPSIAKLMEKRGLRMKPFHVSE